MPFKDPKRKKEYGRQWVANRRIEFFKDKKCSVWWCGSSTKLELDHIDPTQKISHRIWSWSKVRRESELTKCQVLCDKCHNAKSKKNRENGFLPGENHIGSKLKEAEDIEIRERAANGIAYRSIAASFNVSVGTISDIINRNW